MLTLCRPRRCGGVHEIEGASELGGVNPTKGELAVCGLEACRRGERNSDLVRVNETLHECVIGNRWNACGRVREESACVSRRMRSTPVETLPK